MKVKLDVLLLKKENNKSDKELNETMTSYMRRGVAAGIALTCRPAHKTENEEQ